MKHLLFVYGTLQRGSHNNSVLSDGKFISTGWTANKFVLRDCGFPFLIPPQCDDAVPHRVSGEIWEVPSLEHTDALEGHPDWYVRERELIHTPSDTYTCWVYKMYNEEVDCKLCPLVETSEEFFFKWRG